MSLTIIEKINELQENIENVEDKIHSIYDDPFFYYSCNNKIKYIILDLLNEIEVEKKITNKAETIKSSLKQDDINNFFNIKNNFYESNNILNVDGIRYLLVKNNSNQRYHFNKTDNNFYTYKINQEDNHNYVENLPKNKKRICCHCGSKLNYNIISPKEEKNQKREYYCYTCDNTIKVDFNSIIRHNGNTIYAKDINWEHIFVANSEICNFSRSSDEICNFGRKSLEINKHMSINIVKKPELLNIDNENYTIYWYYHNNAFKYAFSSLYNRLLLCKNSIIIHNGKTIPIEYNENCKTYYKLVINGIELSGNRFRSDLLKCIENVN